MTADYAEERRSKSDPGLLAGGDSGDAAAKRALIEAIAASGAANRAEGPDAAHSQDFLYDEDGMPG